MNKTINGSLLLKVAFGLLILLPGLGAFWFGLRLHRYHALLEKYECNRNVYEADFDGDGIPGTLSIDRSAPAADFDSWLVVVDSGTELLREPRRSIDNTLKTHAALIKDEAPVRLIIYDHIFDHRPPRSLVFAYAGKTMVKVAPSEKDKEVLAAMGANDETGSLERWILFQFIVVPTLVCCYAVVAFVGWRIFSKRLQRNR